MSDEALKIIFARIEQMTSLPDLMLAVEVGDWLREVYGGPAKLYLMT